MVVGVPGSVMVKLWKDLPALCMFEFGVRPGARHPDHAMTGVADEEKQGSKAIYRGVRLRSGWRRGSSMGTVHRGRMDMGELKRDDMGNLNEGRRGRKGKGSDDGARLGVFKMKRKGGHGHEQEAAKMQDASRSRSDGKEASGGFAFGFSAADVSAEKKDGHWRFLMLQALQHTVPTTAPQDGGLDVSGREMIPRWIMGGPWAVSRLAGGLVGDLEATVVHITSSQASSAGPMWLACSAADMVVVVYLRYCTYTQQIAKVEDHTADCETDARWRARVKWTASTAQGVHPGLALLARTLERRDLFWGRASLDLTYLSACPCGSHISSRPPPATIDSLRLVLLRSSRSPSPTVPGASAGQQHIHWLHGALLHLLNPHSPRTSCPLLLVLFLLPRRMSGCTRTRSQPPPHQHQHQQPYLPTYLPPSGTGTATGPALVSLRPAPAQTRTLRPLVARRSSAMASPSSGGRGEGRVGSLRCGPSIGIAGGHLATPLAGVLRVCVPTSTYLHRLSVEAYATAASCLASATLSSPLLHALLVARFSNQKLRPATCHLVLRLRSAQVSDWPHSPYARAHGLIFHVSFLQELHRCPPCPTLRVNECNRLSNGRQSPLYGPVKGALAGYRVTKGQPAVCAASVKSLAATCDLICHLPSAICDLPPATCHLPSTCWWTRMHRTVAAAAQRRPDVATYLQSGAVVARDPPKDGSWLVHQTKGRRPLAWSVAQAMMFLCAERANCNPMRHLTSMGLAGDALLEPGSPPATHSPRPLLAWSRLAVYRLPTLLEATAICGRQPSRINDRALPDHGCSAQKHKSLCESAPTPAATICRGYLPYTLPTSALIVAHTLVPDPVPETLLTPPHPYHSSALTSISKPPPAGYIHILQHPASASTICLTPVIGFRAHSPVINSRKDLQPALTPPPPAFTPRFNRSTASRPHTWTLRFNTQSPGDLASFLHFG
ncbi:hypothetical protein PMIN01_07355 [Paraphaeosphaeria minitans]|uniref:Uncharacterized protein n=1 Tax=Paraphaeosphaeria minitans TaxID=565426 RepID=A0A9P6KPU9_9PLEO|nr:hypothetical protein PMIN01_07355 [Paraphaeosphaeria minitans]